MRAQICFIFVLLFFLGDVSMAQTEVPDLYISKVSPMKIEQNEFDDEADFFEFTYYGDGDFEVEELKLFVTDKAERRPLKFELPAMTLHPNDVIRVWCDAENIYGDQIHTNFRLSKWGEDLGLFYLVESDPVLIDQWEYPSSNRNTTSLQKDLEGNLKINFKD